LSSWPMASPMNGMTYNGVSPTWRRAGPAAVGAAGYAYAGLMYCASTVVAMTARATASAIFHFLFVITLTPWQFEKSNRETAKHVRRPLFGVRLQKPWKLAEQDRLSSCAAWINIPTNAVHFTDPASFRQPFVA